MTILNHPSGENEPFVGFRKWQMFATERNTVAACLLGVFEVYHISRLRTAKTQGSERVAINLLQHHTAAQLFERLNWCGTEKTVRNALKLLESKGFISIHSSPERGGRHDRTKYFLFHSEVAEEWIAKYERHKRNQAPSIQSGDLPGLNQAPSIQSGDLPGLNQAPSIQPGDLPDTLGSKREISPVSGKSPVCTYIREKEKEEIKEENSETSLSYFGAMPAVDDQELSSTASNPEPEKTTPQPPSAAPRDRHSELADRAHQVKMQHDPDRPVRSGADYLYKWNINKDPRQIDPEFVAYLVAKQPPWIYFNFEQRKKLDEETVIAHCQKMINTDKRSKIEPDLMDAWKKFATERSAIAALREERAKLAQANDPENNVAYKRFEAALNRFPDRFRIEVADHDWYSLQINVWYKGTQVMQEYRFSYGVLTELIDGMYRVGGKIFTREYMAKALGLEDWDDLFPNAIIYGREVA
jgi:hypothetical protein